jgi:hypothetical protein
MSCGLVAKRWLERRVQGGDWARDSASEHTSAVYHASSMVCTVPSHPLGRSQNILKGPGVANQA